MLLLLGVLSNVIADRQTNKPGDLPCRETDWESLRVKTTLRRYLPIYPANTFREGVIQRKSEAKRLNESHENPSFSAHQV